jgi:CubicO group peptidase (beta-lactamase class C family)
MDKNYRKYFVRPRTVQPIAYMCLAALFAILFLVPLRSSITAHAAGTPRQSVNYAGKLETFVRNQMERYVIPGMAVAIVREGEVEYMQGFGIAGPGGQVVTPDTPFLLASVSKSITATAIMQLVEAGKIQLDDPVRKYLPWFEVSGGEGGEITVLQLLYQTSGFSEINGVRLNLKPDSPDALEAGVRSLVEQKLLFQPGNDWEYSNINYSVLGLLIQQISGQTYEDYITQHIFTPLGMSHSYTSRQAARAAGAASGYYPFFGRPVLIDDYAYTRASLPAGGLWSSASDISRYLIAHLDGGRTSNGSLLSPSSIETLHTPGFKFNDMQGYAMGWFRVAQFMPKEILETLNSDLKNYDNLNVLIHQGDWLNYKSVAYMIPDLQYGLIFA